MFTLVKYGYLVAIAILLGLVSKNPVCSHDVEVISLNSTSPHIQSNSSIVKKMLPMNSIELMEDVTTMSSIESSSSTVAITDSTITSSTSTSRHRRPKQNMIPAINKPSPFLQTVRVNKKLAQAESISSPALVQQNSAIIRLNATTVIQDVAKKPTIHRSKSAPILKQIHDYLIVVLLVAVMFAMGCSITWSQVNKCFSFLKIIDI